MPNSIWETRERKGRERPLEASASETATDIVARVERRDIVLRSDGADLATWLFLPDGPGPHPLVIMAHGFSATRTMTADKYAEVFRAAGLVVLLYDHRGFGASGGQPRQRIDPWTQVREYRDALTFAETLDGVAHDRHALWSDSNSAGVAVTCAAIDDRVSAVAAQAPALGRALPPADPDGSLFNAIRDQVLSGHAADSEDLSEAMPVVSDDQHRRPSALAPLTAYRWFIEYGGRFESGWVNDVTRATPKAAPSWQPALCAPYVRCPVLFQVSPSDEMVGANPEVSRYAFDRLAGTKEWSDLEGGHFGLLYWPSEIFDRASSEQARFLSAHLRRGEQ